MRALITAGLVVIIVSTLIGTSAAETVVVQASAHESTVVEVSFDPSAVVTSGAHAPARDDGPTVIGAALVNAIRQFMANMPLQNVSIGLSGGIDSSVSAALFVEAIGAEQVFGINMPTRGSALVRDVATEHREADLIVAVRDRARRRRCTTPNGCS